jgi:hypothetical protein
MSKNKNSKTTQDKVQELAMQGGIVLMAAAATVGLLAPDDFHNRNVTVPNQPALALAGQQANSEGNNPLRREREETGPHYVSYSVTQRTPGRTGRF